MAVWPVGRAGTASSRAGAGAYDCCQRLASQAGGPGGGNLTGATMPTASLHPFAGGFRASCPRSTCGGA
eukprot:3601271-Alexandrium_andersonii.AAC.1